MEKQLFTQPENANWDQADTMMFGFMDITLIVSIGEHEVGQHFDCAWIDYGKGVLTLCRGDNEEWQYELFLTTGGKMPQA